MYGLVSSLVGDPWLQPAHGLILVLSFNRPNGLLYNHIPNNVILYAGFDMQVLYCQRFICTYFLL